MTNPPRLAVLPSRVATEVVIAAVHRGGRAVSLVLLVLVVPVLIDVFAHRGILSGAVLPAAAVLVAIVALAMALFSPWRAARVAYPPIAIAMSLVYCIAVATALADIDFDGLYLLNRVPIVLIFAGPPVLRALHGVLWSLLGLALCLGVIALADLAAGLPFGPGGGPFVSWLICAALFLAVGAVRARSDARIPDIARLERETRRLALESQFEQRAAAMIHDTVLGDLTAVMNSSGDLDERARERFRADVALLKDPTWLDSAPVQVDVDDAMLRNGTVALTSEMQWRGLSVDVTGTNDAVVRLRPAARAALHEALRQCLENVLLHSGETTAELVVGGDETELTYMVIDHGVGFEPDAVPDDHLGIRHSVVGRIQEQGGTVRIWSRRGSGTSVLLSMPAEGEAP